MYYRLRIFEIFLGVCLSWAASACLAEPVARVNHGNSGLPIWSELSYFERDSLFKLGRAQTGDAEALLALYLIASNSRELDDFNNVSMKIADFLRKFHARGLVSDDASRTGKRLNREMHQAFFLNETRAHGAPGYDAEQSRLAGIFETGEYNCISSALLYGVLARKLGLAIEGVVMPTHAFIQLNLPNGQTIDVETTSPGGFGQVHDEAFYQRQIEKADPAASIAPATYQDYLSRERVSAAELAARNMLNQHTAPQLMADEDSARLAEIAAYIAPTYAQAQERRLYFYNRELQHLINAGQWQTLQRLLDATSESVLQLPNRFGEHPELLAAVNRYRLGALAVYAELGDTERMLGMIGQIMKHADRHTEQRPELELRVTHAVSTLLGKLADKAAFEDGLLVMSLVEGYLQEPASWQTLASWFYLRWSQALWNEGDWPAVVDVLDDFLISARTQSHKEITETLGNAYYNWALESVQAGAEAEGRGIVEQCQVRHGQFISCAKAAQVLRTAVRRRF